MYKKRIEILRKKIKQLQLDALFITSFYNILYYSGFQSLAPEEREGFLLVTEKCVYLFTDSRYVDSTLHELVAKNGLIFCQLEVGKGLLFHLNEIVNKEQVKKLGFESENLSYREYKLISTILKSVEFTATEEIGSLQRAIKDEEEIRLISKACEIGDQCLKSIIPQVKAGMTEKEIALRMEKYLKEKGYEFAFDPIVAFDEHSAIAHYNTKNGNAVLKNGSVILIDYGVKYKNYVSDITRMFFYKTIKDEVRNVYDVLLKAQEKTISYISKSHNPEQIDDYCRHFIVEKDLPNFGHSLGHGVGLEVHEYPRLSKFAKESLEDNQVYTIEPGIYLEGKYGMRIEDTVVQQNGTAKRLTLFSKELAAIG